VEVIIQSTEDPKLNKNAEERKIVFLALDMGSSRFLSIETLELFIFAYAGGAGDQTQGLIHPRHFLYP
jgi:hypothetical protein